MPSIYLQIPYGEYNFIMSAENMNLIRKIARGILKSCSFFLPGYQVVIIKTSDKIIKVDEEKYFQDGMYIENQSSFRKEESFKNIIRKLTDKIGVNYEMDWRTYIAMELSSHASSLEGDFVELGSGEGWIINAIMLRNPQLSRDREIHLFDKFDGFEVDITVGGIKNSIHPRYPIDSRDLFENLEIKDRVFVHTAQLPDGLQVLAQKPIAFLHIDLNAAQTEAQSLEVLYPQIIPNGVILLDDYCGRGREVQHNAINALARRLEFNVVSLPTGQGLILKSS